MKSFAQVFVISRSHVDLQVKLTNIHQINILINFSDIKTFLIFKINTNNKLSMFTAKDFKLQNEIIKSVNEKAIDMWINPKMFISRLSTRKY